MLYRLGLISVFIVFALTLCGQSDTIYIKKIPSDTARIKAEKPSPDNPFVIENFPADYKNLKAKVNDILIYTSNVLPSADIKLDYEIKTPETIEFIESQSISYNKDEISNGGDRVSVNYYFKLTKEGKGELYFENTQYSMVFSKTILYIDISK